ncbi:4'-phosphopantetheinyl transferase superfamily protein [Candidatus Methylospira mobilis]|uniref:4'-phosphopantetheinyl transferase superfamily protein n=1 Tax=Candidatus Methylospira mobilis TaxID=1808979 RepID=A0A5Q0BR01_9GAMM|nr:4'-phosphopantetheinyl transferase superfamily protein [Candidatus Methylospira mobilis]QFY44507.1 4'-phosphopantetheinyl transferase superfamily protein [Candidatus Methylospira mobilis]WNV06063.1 4'-phosphopantetheinyl transferase superfamily protein [Candidatus Methylospira mobilis]
MHPNAVHVWHLPFPDYGAYAEINMRLLSEDEREKANRFVFERDRAHYVTARAALRCLLGGYLLTDPAEIHFSYGVCGKPELGGELAGRLQFNLAHAGNWAIYAVSGGSEIGIDTEPLNNNDASWQQLAPMVFSRHEQAELASIPLQEKHLAFLRGWTRKEAYVKGCGDGLSLALDSFSVPLGSIERQKAVSAADGHSPPDNWWIYPLDPIPAHVTALAVKSRTAAISIHRWNGPAAAFQRSLDPIQLYLEQAWKT